MAISVLTGAGGGVTSFNGRKGAVVPADGDYTKSQVGLGNVDNTSDLNKPISTATQTALDNKQDKITASGLLAGDGEGNITAAEETEVELVEITPDTIGAQSKITATGLLKGDGSGGVTAAVEDGKFTVDPSGKRLTYLSLIHRTSDNGGELDVVAGGYPVLSFTVDSEHYEEIIGGSLYIGEDSNGKYFYGIPTPTTDDGAANKAYVDTAVKGTTTYVTLASASWGGTAAPYTYTISNSAITTTSTQEVLPSTDITADQLTALQEANIIDGGQAAGSMTLKAFGEKPSIDIPIRVVIKG